MPHREMAIAGIPTRAAPLRCPASQSVRIAACTACSRGGARASPRCSAAAKLTQPTQAEPPQPPAHQPDKNLFEQCLACMQNHPRLVTMVIFIVPAIIWLKRTWVCLMPSACCACCPLNFRMHGLTLAMHAFVQVCQLWSAAIEVHGVSDAPVAIAVFIGMVYVVSGWLRHAARFVQKLAGLPDEVDKQLRKGNQWQKKVEKRLRKVDKGVERLLARTVWLSFLDPRGMCM